MPHIIVHDIIHSEKAKTIDQALSIIQQVRSTSSRSDILVLNFAGINWITSMFADRLVKALASYYGNDFEKKLSVTGVEKDNVMFETFWESAIDKFKNAHAQA